MAQGKEIFVFDFVTAIKFIVGDLYNIYTNLQNKIMICNFKPSRPWWTILVMLCVMAKTTYSN
jgi:hypothetical protein